MLKIFNIFAQSLYEKTIVVEYLSHSYIIFNIDSRGTFQGDNVSTRQ